MKKFAEYFKRERALDNAMEVARKKGDTPGMEEIRNRHRLLFEEMEKEGKGFVYLYHLYQVAREQGNDLIDITEPYNTRNEVQGMVDLMRKCGVRNFTMSSTWSNNAYDVYNLVLAGCEIVGMVKVVKEWDSTVADTRTAPAFLFRVKEN